MLAIDDRPKYVHAGTIEYQTFERKDVSDWNLKDPLFDQIQNIVERDFKLKAKRIEPTTAFLSEDAGHWYKGSAKDLGGKRINDMAAIRSQDKVDFLVLVKAIPFPAWINSSFYPEGYGMFTRCTLGFCQAEGLDHVTIFIYEASTNRLISTAYPEKNIDDGQGLQSFFSVLNHYGSPKIPGVIIPDDPKKLLRSEFDKARPILLDTLSKRVAKAMKSAGM
jgi:hypothetical protein